MDHSENTPWNIPSASLSVTCCSGLFTGTRSAQLCQIWRSQIQFRYSDVHACATLPRLTPALWRCARLLPVGNRASIQQSGRNMPAVTRIPLLSADRRPLGEFTSGGRIGPGKSPSQQHGGTGADQIPRKRQCIKHRGQPFRWRCASRVPARRLKGLLLSVLPNNWALDGDLIEQLTPAFLS